MNVVLTRFLDESEYHESNIRYIKVNLETKPQPAHYYTMQYAFFLPPVNSGQCVITIVSVLNFALGVVEFVSEPVNDLLTHLAFNFIKPNLLNRLLIMYQVTTNINTTIRHEIKYSVELIVPSMTYISIMHQCAGNTVIRLW